MAGRFFHEIEDEIVLVGGGEASVFDVFEGATDYKVPIIEYLEATPRQVHEVFNLYNKQGKHLNAEEIRNAVYHELDVMRAFATVAGDGPGFEVTAPFLTPVEVEVRAVGSYIGSCGVSTERFKRTKVVSWLSSLVLTDPVDSNGTVRKLSTARHIDSFLDRATARGDAMKSQSRIRDLVALLSTATRAHSAVEWPEALRGKAAAGRNFRWLPRCSA